MTNATGYKKDMWKSYVIVNDKRKEIIAYISCFVINENTTTLSLEIVNQLSEMLSKILKDNP